MDWNSRVNFISLSSLEVTPFAGVWIEIASAHSLSCCALRHSLRGSVDWNICLCIGVASTLVTPFAGVWIEILIDIAQITWLSSLPSRECGLKFPSPLPLSLYIRHSLRGSVDWNLPVFIIYKGKRCHSLRGSVDWNLRRRSPSITLLVTPFAGVWIEII